MKVTIACTVLLAASLLGVLAWGSMADVGAGADLLDGQGKSVGKATFTETAGGVRIQVHVSKLPPGVHAMHLHTTGECHGPDFKSAGAHFNPFKKKHGLQSKDGPHAGDLPNFTVKADGTADLDLVAPLVSLKSGVNSLFPQGGTCLVIHEKPDDEMSDPAGEAGARIACGILLKQ